MVGESRIVLALQPIVRADKQSTYGYEILSRVLTPEGVRGPLEYAQHHGWAHCDMEVGQLLKCWMEGRLRAYNRPLFLNLSAPTMASDDHFQAWAECLKLLVREKPEGIVIEMSEEVTDADLDRRWDQVCALGARIAMDDLGASESTRERAERFAWDLCKIEMPSELFRLHQDACLQHLKPGAEFIVECIETDSEAIESHVTREARMAYGQLCDLLINERRIAQ